MKILKVTVEDTPQAELLIEMLQGLTFVRKVEDTSVPSTEPPSLNAIRKGAKKRRDRIRNTLLNAPTLTEKELTAYDENRNYLNQWRTI